MFNLAKKILGRASQNIHEAVLRSAYEGMTPEEIEIMNNLLQTGSASLEMPIVSIDEAIEQVEEDEVVKIYKFLEYLEYGSSSAIHDTENELDYRTFIQILFSKDQNLKHLQALLDGSYESLSLEDKQFLTQFFGVKRKIQGVTGQIADLKLRTIFAFLQNQYLSFQNYISNEADEIQTDREYEEAAEITKDKQSIHREYEEFRLSSILNLFDASIKDRLHNNSSFIDYLAEFGGYLRKNTMARGDQYKQIRGHFIPVSSRGYNIFLEMLNKHVIRLKIDKNTPVIEFVEQIRNKPGRHVSHTIKLLTIIAQRYPGINLSNIYHHFNDIAQKVFKSTDYIAFPEFETEQEEEVEKNDIGVDPESFTPNKYIYIILLDLLVSSSQNNLIEYNFNQRARNLGLSRTQALEVTRRFAPNLLFPIIDDNTLFTDIFNVATSSNTLNLDSFVSELTNNEATAKLTSYGKQSHSMLFMLIAGAIPGISIRELLFHLYRITKIYKSRSNASPQRQSYIEQIEQTIISLGFTVETGSQNQQEQTEDKASSTQLASLAVPRRVNPVNRGDVFNILNQSFREIIGAYASGDVAELEQTVQRLNRSQVTLLLTSENSYLNKLLEAENKGFSNLKFQNGKPFKDQNIFRIAKAVKKKIEVQKEKLEEYINLRNALNPENSNDAVEIKAINAKIKRLQYFIKYNKSLAAILHAVKRMFDYKPNFTKEEWEESVLTIGEITEALSIAKDIFEGREVHLDIPRAVEIDGTNNTDTNEADTLSKKRNPKTAQEDSGDQVPPYTIVRDRYDTDEDQPDSENTLIYEGQLAIANIITAFIKDELTADNFYAIADTSSARYTSVLKSTLSMAHAQREQSVIDKLDRLLKISEISLEDQQIFTIQDLYERLIDKNHKDRIMANKTPKEQHSIRVRILKKNILWLKILAKQFPAMTISKFVDNMSKLSIDIAAGKFNSRSSSRELSPTVLPKIAPELRDLFDAITSNGKINYPTPDLTESLSHYLSRLEAIDPGFLSRFPLIATLRNRLERVSANNFILEVYSTGNLERTIVKIAQEEQDHLTTQQFKAQTRAEELQLGIPMQADYKFYRTITTTTAFSYTIDNSGIKPSNTKQNLLGYLQQELDKTLGHSSGLNINSETIHTNSRELYERIDKLELPENDSQILLKMNIRSCIDFIFRVTSAIKASDNSLIEDLIKETPQSGSILGYILRKYLDASQDVNVAEQFSKIKRAYIRFFEKAMEKLSEQ